MKVRVPPAMHFAEVRVSRCTHRALLFIALLFIALLAGCAISGCSCSNAITVGEEDGGAPLDAPRVDGAPGEGDAFIPGLLSLRIDPVSATVTDDGIAPGERASFRLFGVFDGGERELTDVATWALEPTTLGTIALGAFTSSSVGGRGTVIARVGGMAITAALVVVLEIVVVDDGLLPDVVARFASDPAMDTDGTAVDLRFIYPSDGTMFPQNLGSTLQQWRGAAALDVFELRFDSDVAHVRFYTSDRAYLVERDAWRWLAMTHAGSSADVTVRAVDDAVPGTVYRSQIVTELWSRSEVLGALYYWSTGAQGVMRAHISSRSASRFYTEPASGDTKCVSCHTVSRNGHRLAVGYDGERLREVTIPERTLLIPATPAARGPDYGWGTFNPEATRLLYANRGVLRLLDADTGADLGLVPLPAGTYATHPDWSPDGSFVAVALSTREPDNKKTLGSSIARMAVLPDGSFGEPEIVVSASDATDTLFFPSVSPDSRLVAYVHATGASKDNQTSVLELARSDGAGAPIVLTILNERVRDEDGVIGIGNSMPTWAPSTTADVFWLAFSSLRDYGDVLVGTDRDQLWGAAIDPARALAGADPTYAAFWMPFQQLDEGNHRAFWVLADEDVCPSTVELCDGLDNDCDAIVDELCCTPSAEICADGIDNDCDGSIDENCMCGVVEICDNGLDDDCDGRIDAMDEDCILF